MKRNKPTKSGMQYPVNVIMANDPSLTAWGWAVLEPDGTVIDTGAIKTTPSPAKMRIRKGDDRVRRITELNNQLIKVIKEHKVSYLLSELPHGSQSAVLATMIGMICGIQQTISDCLGIPVEWFSEKDAKTALAGRSSLTKKETIERIDKLYNVEWHGTKWENEAVADALAIFHVATQQSNVIKMMR